MWPLSSSEQQWCLSSCLPDLPDLPEHLVPLPVLPGLPLPLPALHPLLQTSRRRSEALLHTLPVTHTPRTEVSHQIDNRGGGQCWSQQPPPLARSILSPMLVQDLGREHRRRLQLHHTPPNLCHDTTAAAESASDARQASRNAGRGTWGVTCLVPLDIETSGRHDDLAGRGGQRARLLGGAGRSRAIIVFG